MDPVSSIVNTITKSIQDLLNNLSQSAQGSKKMNMNGSGGCGGDSCGAPEDMAGDAGNTLMQREMARLQALQQQIQQQAQNGGMGSSATAISGTRV